ncbi:alkaline shock response membrane anchor protein AmaP [Nocardioides sp. NPDC047086]|uniref:alkaline shock response membrane anchor protein AmaP n=1 Tax=Nocardioides sp. NPDC047086 TaxID=3154810 RepID=UPI0033CEEC49
MTPRMIRTDRALTLLVAILLVALGLLALDWHFRWVFGSYPSELSTQPAGEVVTASWFPWALAVAGIVLGFLGLVWLLAHLRRRGPSTLRLQASDETGRVQADLRSIADAAADRLQSMAALTGVTGTVATIRSRPVIMLRGRIDPVASVASLTEAAEICAQDVAAAFPDQSISCRILVDSPRRGKGRQQSQMRVR